MDEKKTNGKTATNGGDFGCEAELFKTADKPARTSCAATSSRTIGC